MVFLCHDCCVSSSTRQCDLLCYMMHSDEIYLIQLLLSFCSYFCVRASCSVYSVTICSSELSSIVSIVFPPSGQDHFHGLSGYAVAIVYIIHTIDQWLPNMITKLRVTRQTWVSIRWSQRSLRWNLSWSTAMAPWILGLHQQAHRPMQSKTRIIAFSVKDWIFKFSHTMAISEFLMLRMPPRHQSNFHIIAHK